MARFDLIKEYTPPAGAVLTFYVAGSAHDAADKLALFSDRDYLSTRDNPITLGAEKQLAVYFVETTVDLHIEHAIYGAGGIWLLDQHFPDTDAAIAAQVAAEASAVSTAADRIQTAADRVQTGLDVTAANAGAAAATGMGYPTRALMDAAAGLYTEGQVVRVTNDPTLANNGEWIKGATGWVQSSFDRVAVVESRATTLEGYQNKNWLSPTAVSPINQTHRDIIKAIKAVICEGGDHTKTYRLRSLMREDATYGYLIRVWDQNDALVAEHNPNAIIAGADTGPIWRTFGSTVKFHILIDYRELATDLYFSENISYFEFSPVIYAAEKIASQAATIGALATETSSRIAADDSLALADIPWLARDVLASGWTAPYREVAKAIKRIKIAGGIEGERYRIRTFCKDDPTYTDNIYIYNAANVEVARKIGPIAKNPTGITKVELGTAPKFTLWVNYNEIISSGILISSNTAPLVIDPNYNDPRAAAEVYADSLVPLPSLSLPRPLRIAAIDSSTTWGEGYLGENSWLGYLEKDLRTRLAQTIHGRDMTTVGSATPTSHKLFYDGAALVLSGVNASAETTLFGDEVSIAIGRERGNDGAALVALYIDGALHDTFTTRNDEPQGTDTLTFSGTGSAVKFDLGRAYTYGHAVTVGGVAKTGGLNIQGIGGAIPGGHDYMVIRQLVEQEVHHILWFAAAPPAGSNNIAVTYSFGESICYAQTTIGQVGQGLGSGLESAYGDGEVSYDPANPATLSSGLDFRQSDIRAIKTWKFSASKTRTVKLVIQGLDPQGSGTPKLWLNFVTNRMHMLQNAGIGGWTAALFLSDTGGRTVDAVNLFRPDIVILGTGPNDDWIIHQWTAFKSLTGVTEAQLRAIGSSVNLDAVSGSGDSYTVQDSRIPCTNISARTVTLDGVDAIFSITAGDVVILGGEFFGDNRRRVTRLVQSWDAGTRMITFDRGITADDFIQIATLEGLIGTSVQVVNKQGWVDNLSLIVAALRGENPDSQIILMERGLHNPGHRRLDGYAEKARELARTVDALTAPVFSAVKEWTYTQPRDRQLYLNAAQGAVSTGSAEYPLYLSTGVAVSDLLLRNVSVLVDGVERLHADCHIAGGYQYGWQGVSAPLTLANDVLAVAPYKLVFTNDVPPVGATVVVKHTTAKWSSDDTHPGTVGMPLIGLQAFAATDRAVVRLR